MAFKYNPMFQFMKTKESSETVAKLILVEYASLSQSFLMTPVYFEACAVRRV